MAKHQAEYKYDLPTTTIQLACQQVGQELGRQNWYVVEENPGRLIFQESLPFTFSMSARLPITIEINMQSVSSRETKLFFSASTPGLAPVLTKHCKEAVQKLHESISTAATTLLSQGISGSGQIPLTTERNQYQGEELQGLKYRVDYSSINEAGYANLCIYDYDVSPLLFAKVSIDLKEGMEFYLDQGMRRKVLALQTPTTKGFARYYNVNDLTSGKVIGLLKQDFTKSTTKAIGFAVLHSIVGGPNPGSGEAKEKWILLNPNEDEIATVKTKGEYFAHHEIVAGSSEIAVIRYTHTPTHIPRQPNQPLHYRMLVEFSSNARIQFDKRLGVIQAVVLCTAEHQKALKISG